MSAAARAAGAMIAVAKRGGFTDHALDVRAQGDADRIAAARQHQERALQFKGLQYGRVCPHCTERVAADLLDVHIIMAHPA